MRAFIERFTIPTATGYTVDQPVFISLHKFVVKSLLLIPLYCTLTTLTLCTKLKINIYCVSFALLG